MRIIEIRDVVAPINSLAAGWTGDRRRLCELHPRLVIPGLDPGIHGWPGSSAGMTS